VSTFVAIDFETANYSRDSACAVGLTLCRDDRVLETRQFLIRPPSREFTFTYIHGLTWNDVRNAPDFGGLWPQIRPYIECADFYVAHNASFDRGVLDACCSRYRLSVPPIPFECTLQVARSFFGFRPANLPAVCQQLGISLQHHNAGSDAEACARILLAARQRGWEPQQ
jgi:DNA polymerase III subunit epsilon